MTTTTSVPPSRKDTLISILEQLVGYRELAEGFLVLVKMSENEKFIEELYTFMKEQIMAIKDSQQKEKVVQQLSKIKEIQQREQSIEENEHKEANKMLDDLFLNEI
jgi:hypothetical protein